MTVPVSSRRAGPFACDGVETDFDFAFKVFAESNVGVVLTDSDGLETTLTLNSHYTVVLNGDQENNPGGTITTIGGSSPYATGNTITMLGTLSYRQSTNITSSGGFLPAVVMAALDYLCILTQQLKELADRSLRLPVSATGASTELPTPEASTFIGWNALGTALVNYAGVASAAVSAAMAPVVAATTLALARAAMGATAIGEALFTAVDAAAARAAIGVTDLPVADTTAIVKGSADATKLLRFEVDGFTTATTRVLTPPNYNGTIATLDGTEVFTNKTLTSPAINTPVMNTSITGTVLASQSDMEAAASNTLLTTPGRIHYHPGVAKGWAAFNSAAGINRSYNVTSITDTGTGQAAVNWNVDFSDSSHCDQCTVTSSTNIFGLCEGTSAGASTVACRNSASGALQDPTLYNVVGYGDQ